MSCKGAAAFNVLALMITFFGRFTEIAARAGMSDFSAKWAMHHKNLQRLGKRCSDYET
jgi:hypothetical protein